MAVKSLNCVNALISNVYKASIYRDHASNMRFRLNGFLSDRPLGYNHVSEQSWQPNNFDQRKCRAFSHSVVFLLPIKRDVYSLELDFSVKKQSKTRSTERGKFVLPNRSVLPACRMHASKQKSVALATSPVPNPKFFESTQGLKRQTSS